MSAISITPGVRAATAPVTYDPATQTVALAIGAGLSVTGGALVASGGGGTPGGTSGQLQFNNAGAFAGAGITWDATNSRVGVGVASPSYPFQVNSAAGMVLAADCEATYHSACAPAYGFVGATSPDSVFYYSPGTGMMAVQSGEPGGLRLTATAGTGDVALQSAGGSLAVRHDGVAASSGAVQAGGSLRATGNTYSAFTGQGAELYFDPVTSTGGFVTFDRTAGAYLGFTADALAHHWKLSGVHGVALLAGPALGIGTANPQGLLHLNGGPVLIGAGSSTGAERPQGKLAGSWADNTDATFKGRITLKASDSTGTDREGVRVESDGTRPLVGFYGTAAVAKPSGGVLAALAGLGLVTSPTLAAADLPSAGLRIDSHYSTIVADTYAPTMTLDASTNDDRTITLAGNPTVTISNMVNGQKVFLEFIQGGAGGYVPAFTNTIRWQGGTPPTYATAVGKADLVAIVRRYDGTYAGGMTLSNY